MALMKKQTTPVDDLHQQRVDLVKRLAEAQAIMQNADPVVNWEKVSKATADVMALERALVEVDKRIAGAEREQRQASAQAAEAATHERKVQALAGARTAAHATVEVLRHFDKTVLADLDAAIMELAHAGGYPPPEVAHVVNLRGNVKRTLALVGDAQPDWLGLPPHRSPQEIAITEARHDLERAEKRLTDLGKMRERGQRWQDLVGEAEAHIKRCQARVTALTGETFALSNLGAKVASMARYIDPPRDEVLV